MMDICPNGDMDWVERASLNKSGILTWTSPLKECIVANASKTLDYKHLKYLKEQNLEVRALLTCLILVDCNPCCLEGIIICICFYYIAGYKLSLMSSRWFQNICE